ncbi:MAG: endonuclease [Candidatus Azobacteroides sp.]|nr:endonuclease [Candidatus Azobacteroides sp.]
MRKRIIYLFCLNVIFINLSFGQNTLRIMSYNVENLFDTEKSSRKNDGDFTPDGKLHWTPGRYYNKLNNLAKVITSAGEWNNPAIIGLCEVENERCMTDLTKHSLLKAQDYRYVITHCADRRGINVALMYQRDKFKYLGHQSYKIKFPEEPHKVTRDILHVSGLIQTGDTLDVFVCHFPSRRGGEQESEPDRIRAASVLKSKTDSLMNVRKNFNIVIMGDFNDEPDNNSLSRALQAMPVEKNIEPGALYNLFYKYVKQNNVGTYKYGRQWNVLDQMIVSGNLFNRSKSFHVLPETATIFQRDFMMEKDSSNGGKKPFKTYTGMKHTGGYSDHLPVFVDFSIISQPEN